VFCGVKIGTDKETNAIEAVRHIIQHCPLEILLNPETSMRAFNWLAGLSLFLSVLAICGLWILLLSDVCAVFLLHENIGAFRLAKDLWFGTVIWGVLSLLAYSLTQPVTASPDRPG
jgi:hypothetical protein